MIPLLLFAAAALSGLYYVWSNWALYRISAKLKGPLALPFLGCAWLIIGKTHEGEFPSVLTQSDGEIPPNYDIVVWRGYICEELQNDS